MRKGNSGTTLAAGAIPDVRGDAPSLLVDKEETVGRAVEALRRAPDGRIGVRGSDGEVEAELWLSDPGLHDELVGAKEVQQRLLPRVVPTVKGFDFAGRYAPAGHVGGDYWSVKYYREEGIVTCKLADVTGHGIGAAILMAAVKFVSGVLFRSSPSPAVVMERTNHSLLRETNPDKLATMIYAWVYPDTRRVRLVNAGHSPAFLCRAGGSMEDIPATGPLLGLIETTYEELVVTLAPGDLLFFCSDGVAEAGDPRAFGEARVKEIVGAHRAQPADAIADAVFASAQDCCGAPKDDMSLLVIKATEAKPASKARSKAAK
jgi:sigma-B regulation protein RsbU (phosphoserine phosphatase)